MVLQKGFLGKNKIEITGKNLIFLWAVSFVMAFLLYGLFVLIRESFRISTASLGGQEMLVLSAKETFFYNIFFAALASVFGFSLALKLSIENWSLFRKIEPRVRQRAILHDQTGFTWYLLFWFTKIAFQYAIICLTWPVWFDIDLYQNFKYLFFLLPIVYFLNSWLTIQRTFRKKAYPWLLSSFLVILAHSIILGNINFVNVEKINEKILARNVKYNYQVDLPKSVYYNTIPVYPPNIDIYIGYDHINKDSPKIIIQNKNGYQEVSIDYLEEVIHIKTQDWDVHKKNSLKIILRIDKDVPMGYIQLIRGELRRIDQRKIIYAVLPKYSKYPPNYPELKRLGIPETLPIQCQETLNFIDSLKSLKLSKYHLRFPWNSLCFSNYWFKNSNRIRINLRSNELVTLNNEKIDITDIKMIAKKFLQKNSSSAVVLLEVNDEVNYNKYIEVKEQLELAVYEIRNEYSLEMNNQPLRYYQEKLHEEVEQQYINILRQGAWGIWEMTPEELELERLAKG
ncbi:hypothetical protein QQ008_25680 [Fulvivirgaceae bacterium BMA10]|uniref:Uncharacterized protein n=1 Tax=Splendidivirga corallicola TaxID=3051826 RepID=A0ABT8KVK0_9BACT|nr:hypothetical protein [Fulvivirgaceae bacterium BMA10]